MDTCPLTLVSLFAPGMEQSWRHTCLLINAPLCRRAAWQVTVSNPGRGLGILGRHHRNIKTVALSVYLSASTLFVQINIGSTHIQSYVSKILTVCIIDPHQDAGELWMATGLTRGQDLQYLLWLLHLLR